jgi:CheY-like chemotaxis protein
MVPTGQKILLVDDSAMLLSFVKEVLEEQGYQVAMAETGEEGLKLARSENPALILLDFVLPDMKGDEVCRRLLEDPTTAKIPVLYVSGLGSELAQERPELSNIIGLLSKPFTSEALINSTRKHLPATGAAAAFSAMDFVREVSPPAVAPRQSSPPPPIAVTSDLGSLGSTNGPEPVAATGPERTTPPAIEIERPPAPLPEAPPTKAEPSPAVASAPAPNEDKSQLPGDPYFCGDSGFFSLNWALHIIAAEKLTGTLRAFWSRDSVELLAQEGMVVVVTTRNPALYCEESPVTLLNVPEERVEAARKRQSTDGCPLFLTLADEGLILREPGLELVQHYGSKLFSQLWTDRVRFTFVQHVLPDYAREIPASEDEIDQWTLNTLRFVQYQELGHKAEIDASWIPAYTRDGFDRVQELRLTVAEAQFASQFNGSRSIMQISKNLRLDIKFARLTLFRFLALEIVECWPPELTGKPEARSLRGFFGR